MQELFTPPSGDSFLELTSLYQSLRKVMPLKQKQYMVLPKSIQQLSYILTQNRGELPLYWASPAFTSAYFYYFMPWNLVRLAQLLPNLSFPEISYIKEHPYILDIGSGTLTIPIALWLFRKELRNIPLTIYCLDTSKKPMEYGKRLLEMLMGEPTWNIVLLDARTSNKYVLQHRVALTTASNVLNELVQKRTTHMEDTIHRFYTTLTRSLGDMSHALCIEIGTRLGGNTISLLRNSVLEAGIYDIIAPCTHQGECPYAQEKASSWCHFTFADFVAPQWLESLSSKACLAKTTLSTSFLHIGNGVTQQYNSRILSAPIYLPQSKEHIRYTCTEGGIVALEKARRYVQGTALNTRRSSPERIDVKTKHPFAFIVTQKRRY